MAAQERDVLKLGENSERMHAKVCVWVSEWVSECVCVSLFFKSTVYYV